MRYLKSHLIRVHVKVLGAEAVIDTLASQLEVLQDEANARIMRF